MRRSIAGVAFIGLALSIIVHGATFLGVDLSKEFPLVWGLHLGIFPFCLLMVLEMRGKEVKSHGFVSTSQSWKKFLAPMPPWVKYIAYAALAYTLINFALFFFLGEGGTPELRGAKYVLHDHGRIIRELTEQEYHLQEAYVLRGFSGHWMFFYITSGFYFWFQRPITDEC